MPKCCSCRNNAVVRLPYAGVDMCKKHFLVMFEKRVWRANREFKLFKRGETIAVGVSGGKDSAALLYVLWKIGKKIGFKVKPILVDEGIKGYREKAAKSAEKLCRKLGLKLTKVSYRKLYGFSLDQILRKRNRKHLQFGACTACGVLRRDALNITARKLGADKLAIGHNADDVAQTFIMNALRGDLFGFQRFGVVSGVAEQENFVLRIKPLVFNLERDCALYSALNGLPFYSCHCPYSNEAFRGEAKKFLNELEKGHPGTKFNVLQYFLGLKKLVPKPPKEQRTAAKCSKCGEHSSSTKCRKCVLLESLGST
ncbi:TIGR00269 family protein [Candidatus Micrarchaeota archaeon]|nr:TIGR00269 family protein [Candidatus Micrarchaeota archaeon]